MRAARWGLMAVMKKLIAAGLVAALALAGAPLAAQQDDQPQAAAPQADIPQPKSFSDAPDPPKPAKVIGPQAYGPAPPPKKCSSTDTRRPGEIVVCGTKDNDEFRVKSSADLDSNSKQATDDGRPHAPDFAESCKKNPENGPCIHFGKTPVPAYIIDFKDLPDTPEGSDADLIAKGEKKGG
ncbi:MAG: hypothetical protein P0Y56_11525 [Candidatus Andeanibacterium colombiense]|uniref:Uncharacterized protein n=1 Tax=Candidatus Andeanibacterium colombiense TaxID=3121345 RepID=A0AAJ5X378_9SPHN|nr:MAG: hypothetical protein P0Y56_11525 [Sphingomonadaceae bacterium]